MTSATPIKRTLTLALASGLLLTAMSSPVHAQTTEPDAGILAVSNAPCDKNGTTSTDATLASRLNGMLTTDLRSNMTAYRVSCARMVIKEVRDRELPTKAAIIAIATVVVETRLQNHDVAVDHDSLGLFQQRGSWGSAENRIDPAWATNAFLNKMMEFYPNNSWLNTPVGDVAKTVQRPAPEYAGRYALYENDATKIVNEVWDYAGNSKFDSFSGDARADLVVHSGTEVSVRAGGSDGGFDGGRSVSLGWGRYHGMQMPDGLGRLYFADYDGDHYTDMIVHHGTEISVRLNTGNNTFDGGRSVSLGWGRYHGMQVPDGLGRLYFADYNGDGRADMFVHHGTEISVRLGQSGGGFDGGRSVSLGWGRYHGMQVPDGLGRLYFADYNGDDRADMFVHHGTEISVRLGQSGGGFDGGRSVSLGWGRYHGLDVPEGLGRLYFADYNGDGRADMFVHHGTEISVRLAQSSGGFDGGRSVSLGWGRYHGMQIPEGLGRLYLA